MRERDGIISVGVGDACAMPLLWGQIKSRPAPVPIKVCGSFPLTSSGIGLGLDSSLNYSFLMIVITGVFSQ